MRQSKAHTIDGFTYTIAQLGAKDGRKVLARVLRAVAGAAGDAAGLATGVDATEAALAGVAKLIENLSDADVDYLCDSFAPTTLFGPEGKDVQLQLKDNFDDHFAGRYGALVKWLWAALETNYASFFASLGLEGIVAQAKALTMKTSTPSAPTAPSGASSSPASAS